MNTCATTHARRDTTVRTTTQSFQNHKRELSRGPDDAHTHRDDRKPEDGTTRAKDALLLLIVIVLLALKDVRVRAQLEG